MSEQSGDKPSERPQDDTDPADGKQEQTNDEHTEMEDDRPQDPWAARRDLYEHVPAAVGGSLVGGDQTGVSGGSVGGDVVLGTKVEHHYRFGATTHISGNIPPAELDQLALEFAGYEELVHPLRDRLREERVLVLYGAPFTGRRSAALMLLRSLDAVPVRAIDPNTRPTALLDEVNGDQHGYLVSDLVTGRENPLRDIDLWAVRDVLRKKGAYLVITVDLLAILRGVDAVSWHPPSPQAVLRSHLHALVDDPQRERELLALDLSREFLDRDDHQLREAAQFAKALAGHADGTITREKLAGVGPELVREQVREWFGDDETLLRDRAFLISLAAFDEAAYALTAELSDTLYAEFQRTEDAGREPQVGIFGTSITKRLRLARAVEYRKEEHTEWGPVFQRMARFQEPRASVEVLREVWTSHPSARPALLAWLRKLAQDGRPLVRTRAAVTAAVLAQTDLPSAMALLIEGWAKSKVYRDCLVAANALAAAHAIGAPNIPQILRSWCDEEAGPRLRWTAIRAYALVGARMPDEALNALAEAARTGDDEQEAQHIAESAALLLSDESAPVRSRLLRGLLQILRDGPSGRRLALHAFVLACTRADNRLMLRWYTAAASAGPAEDAQQLSLLWRTALGDLGYTAGALKALAGWVREADGDPQAERELAMLLPALVGSDEDRKRLDHMLLTLRGRRGSADAPPAVASRLRGVL
ncbi:LigA protein [Streptomyces sp. 769]|nr:LigA protein [Streptomyces sp. 769]